MNDIYYCLYLVDRIYNKIKRKEEAAERWRQESEYHSPQFGERVQTSRTSSTPYALDKYLELSGEIEELKSNLIESQHLILKLIEPIPAPMYEVIHRHCICLQTYRQIAEEMRKSETFVTYTYKDGVKFLEEIECGKIIKELKSIGEQI